MQTVYIMKGLPASGKSTKAKQMVEVSGGTLKRINKDDLRAMMDMKWSREREKLVIITRDHIILTWLTEGFDVVVDDTNLAKKHVTRIEAIVNEYNKNYKKEAITKIIDYSYSVSVYECLRRDRERENPVGDDTIWRMYSQFIQWTKPEAKKDESKEDVYLCDLDGTIALHNGRNPYSYEECIHDLPNMPVVNVIRSLTRSGFKIVFVTAREDIGNSKALTIQWIEEYIGIKNPEVITRELSDNRKDNITKREMYDKYIFPKYNVIGIFDDRKQVVDMWRDMDIMVFDVAGHTF